MASTASKPFLETFEFVEQAQERAEVPNHLIESKIYAKISQNEAVSVTPSVVHFGGFELDKPSSVTITLCNVSRDLVRMHISPPQTKYFSIRYTKLQRLVPGLTMDVLVTFKPDEWRYYYDSIKIHCPGEDNLIIPIHAYPVMDPSDFPQRLQFPVTAIGKMRSRDICLRSKAPVDFEFTLSKLEGDIGSYDVQPSAGVVPASGEVEVIVTFCPTAYMTSHLKLQLLVSQFNAKPMICYITGSCSPNVGMDKDAEHTLQMDKSFSALDRLKQRRAMKLSKTKTKTSFGPTPKTSKSVIEREGLRFTGQMNTPHHVSRVLIQTPGRMQVKDILEAEMLQDTRQVKETKFTQAVRKAVHEERQNTLRWQCQLGGDALTDGQRLAVREQRKEHWEAYRRRRGDALSEEENERLENSKIARRSSRYNHEIGKEGVMFDFYTNNPWPARHVACDRFAQAARKIILQNRAQKSLTKLTIHRQRAMLSEVQSENNDSTDDKAFQASLLQHFVPEKVSQKKYPYFVEPKTKDDMAPDALSDVTPKPTAVAVDQVVSYYDLQVPHTYRVLGYNNYSPERGHGYVAPQLARPLRTGAVEEIIDTTGEMCEDSKVSNDQSSRPEAIARVSTPLPVEQTTAKDFSMKAPEALLKPVEYPSLHIFNPAPGLQVFQPPIPYAEVDPDYHLCPLPRYTSSAPTAGLAPLDTAATAGGNTQRRFLDRDDIIRGTQTWKRFPSQGLMTLSSTVTLTGVWVPRWSDPFTDAILPEAPALQSSLNDEDVLMADDETEEMGLLSREATAISGAEFKVGGDRRSSVKPCVELTPDMVNAQFSLVKNREEDMMDKSTSDKFPFCSKIPTTNMAVSSTGPVPREKREMELDIYLGRKSNRLGAKIAARIETLNNVTSNKDIVFK